MLVTDEDAVLCYVPFWTDQFADWVASSHGPFQLNADPGLYNKQQHSQCLKIIHTPSFSAIWKKNQKQEVNCVIEINWTVKIKGAQYDCLGFFQTFWDFDVAFFFFS